MICDCTLILNRPLQYFLQNVLVGILNVVWMKMLYLLRYLLVQLHTTGLQTGHHLNAKRQGEVEVTAQTMPHSFNLTA